MSAIETQFNVAFADVGIDVSRCRPGRDGECKTICPFCVHTHSPGKQRNKDLRVNVIKGAWFCHRCAAEGSLEHEARKRDGWQTPQPNRSYRPMATARTEPEQKITTATPVAADTLAKLPTALHQWAIDFHHDRGISKGTLESFGVVSQEWKDDAGELQRQVIYPYRVDGAVTNAKKRRLTAPDGKAFTMLPDCAKSMYNIDTAEGSDLVVIVEGEADVLACAEAGWTAISPPNGAPGKIENKETGEVSVADAGKKLDALYEAKSARVLAAAKRIVVAVDDDMEGDALREAIVERLKPWRCWEVTAWPEGCKDANDVLVKHGPAALDAVLEQARPVNVPGIGDFAKEREALWHIYRNGYDEGVSTGWEALDTRFKPRRGTINTITGIPGNGKTSWVHALFANLAHLHDWKFGMFSPESGDVGTLFGKLVQLIADAPILPSADQQMSEAELDAAAAFVETHFWRVDASRADDEGYQVVTLPEIIDRLETLVLRHGIEAAIVDPWNRLEAARNKNQTETEYVAWAINMLSRFAQRHNVCVFVVAHPHKMDVGAGGEEEPMPSPYNIAGSAHWYNMSDTILGVKRNKYTEPKNRTTVKTWKIREEGTSGELGEVYFYYDGKSRRFYTDPEQVPMEAGTNSYAPPKRTTGVVPSLFSAAAPWEQDAIAAD